MAWTALLDRRPEELPDRREWRPLLGALRRVTRFTGNQDLHDASPYMIASAARQLLDELRPEISHAGIAAPLKVTAEDAPKALREAVTAMLSCLTPTTRYA
jgi:hypothetical protein